MTNCFDDALITDFAQTFYGYGNYSGPYWFVGMEEAGGDSFEEVERRLVAWSGRGQRELEDVASFHKAIGHDELFQEHPPLQRTWSKLMRIILSAERDEVDREKLREYQRDSLGRLEGQSCLIELFPLPSPSTAHWMYAEHSTLHHLASRKAYHEHYVKPRIEHIRESIKWHKPKAVIFYSTTFHDLWRCIVEPSYIFEERNGVLIAQGVGTTFFIIKHPVTRGITNAYFHNVGQMIKL